MHVPRKLGIVTRIVPSPRTNGTGVLSIVEDDDDDFLNKEKDFFSLGGSSVLSIIFV